MHKTILFLLSILASANSICTAQILTDSEAAFSQSRSEKKPILLIFSGSDWCAPCIQFERKVLTDSSFLNQAKQLVVLLKADFPQRKQLSATHQAANNGLAEAYNPEGSFPKIVVLDTRQKAVATIQAANQTPATLIDALTRLLLQVSAHAPH